MIYPTRLGENGPGGYGKQFTCLTAPNYSMSSPQNVTDNENIRKLKAKEAKTFAHGPEGSLSLAEASSKYGCPYKTLYNNVRLGNLAATMMSGDFFVTKENLIDFINNRWHPRARKAS